MYFPSDSYFLLVKSVFNEICEFSLQFVGPFRDTCMMSDKYNCLFPNVLKHVDTLCIVRYIKLSRY
jgi:hypothetical protein